MAPRYRAALPFGTAVQFFLQKLPTASRSDDSPLRSETKLIAPPRASFWQCGTVRFIRGKALLIRSAIYLVAKIPIWVY